MSKPKTRVPVGIWLTDAVMNVIEAVLMDKGVVIGVEHETATRSSLDFAMFRIQTSVRPLLGDCSSLCC